jgi:hypothetical protein
MKNNTLFMENNVSSILLSDEYWIMLKNIGFSKDFILNERIRKQKECIEYLIKQQCDSI